MKKVFIIQEISILASGEISPHVDLYTKEEIQEQLFEARRDDLVNSGYDYDVNKDGHHIFTDADDNVLRYVLGQEEVQ